MLDTIMRPIINPPLRLAAAAAHKLGITPNQVTLAGAAVALMGAVAAGFGDYKLALVFIILNRILDGLDGAIARIVGGTDFGGYLDIVCDFIFYVALPVGFGLSNPDFLLPAFAMVAASTLTGISFLAYAAIASKKGLETMAHGPKSFYYNTGLIEGTETIITLILLCILPGLMPVIAYIYSVLCLVTVVQRSIGAWREF